MGGTVNVGRFTSCCKFSISEAVTFNSNKGSVSVVHTTKVKVTVKKTSRTIGDITSCVARTISRGNIQGTLIHFNVLRWGSTVGASRGCDLWVLYFLRGLLGKFGFDVGVFGLRRSGSFSRCFRQVLVDGSAFLVGRKRVRECDCFIFSKVLHY